MKQERFPNVAAPASPVKISAAFIPLRKYDSGAADWILKKAKEIGAETLAAEQESARKVDWPRVKQSLSFGFYKAAELPAESDKKPMQIHDRNIWRAIYAYCHDADRRDRPVKLSRPVWEKMKQVEDAECARLDAMRPTALERRMLKIWPSLAKGL